MWNSRTWAGLIAAISGCVIWPTFSSSVIEARIDRTRASSALESLIRLSTRGQSDSFASRSSIRAQPCSMRGWPTRGCALLCAPLTAGTDTTAATASIARPPLVMRKRNRPISYPLLLPVSVRTRLADLCAISKYVTVSSP